MAKRKSTSEIKGELKALKKSGLVNIDLRKVTDKQLEDKKVRGGLLRTLSRFKDVVTGQAKTVKVADKKAREALKSRGHRTANNGLVIISTKAGENVKADKKGNLTFTRKVRDRKTRKEKIEIVHEPNLNFKGVQTVEDAINAYADQYKTGNKKIAFTYYGNISKRTYSDVKEALLEILNYEQSQNVIGTSLNPADVPEIMKSVQIVEYVDAQNYGRSRALIKDSKASFNKYFKKLGKKK